jgi:hypothetical protein
MRKLLLTLLILSSSVFAFWGKSGVKPVDNELYLNECGSCHFAFQPGLLPQRSWVKMMKGLEDHFGSDATLDEIDHQAILKYLDDNSAEKATEYKRSKKMLDSIPSNSTPLEITKVRYFVHEHDEIPRRFIRQKEVGTLSNCAACHTTASKGSYNEDDILIPNVGRWDD